MTLLLKLFLYPFIVLVGALGLFAFKNAKKTISKYRKLENREHDPSWDGFIRKDFNKWNEKNILIGCFIRFPFKLIALISYIACIGITILFSLKFTSLEKKISKPIVRFMVKFLLSLVIKIDQKETIEQTSSPMIISNHVSWIDVLYLEAKLYPVSIVAKEEISNTLLVGLIARYLQCIFISRKDGQARKNVLEKIQQRMKDRISGIEVNPLLIFPEGTTSNGRSILEFKKGAFTALPKITIFGLIYDCQGFDMGMDQVTPIEHFIISLSLKPKLTVKTSSIEPCEGQDSQQYMVRCQKQLSKLTGFQIYQSGYVQKCVWEERREEQLQL